MRLPLGPWLALAFVAALTAAAAHDLAFLAGHVLRPWFGWMLP